jgi:hypothetical protein
MASRHAEVRLYLRDEVWRSHGTRSGPFRRLRATFRLHRLFDPFALRRLELGEATESEQIASAPISMTS